jgi:hypothetical protein
MYIVYQLIFNINIVVGFKLRERILRGNPGTDPTIVSLLLKLFGKPCLPSGVLTTGLKNASKLETNQGYDLGGKDGGGAKRTLGFLLYTSSLEGYSLSLPEGHVKHGLVLQR